jgi:hypothetical protein
MWYLRYQDEISWFVIGFLVEATLDQLCKGNYTSAAIDGVLAYFNYFMWKTQRL